jgi:ArsR family transcriptional regulator
MGHVWLGFSEDQISRWLQQAGLSRVTVRALPPRTEAKGPGLFVSTGTR